MPRAGMLLLYVVQYNSNVNVNNMNTLLGTVQVEKQSLRAEYLARMREKLTYYRNK